MLISDSTMTNERKCHCNFVRMLLNGSSSRKKSPLQRPFQEDSGRKKGTFRNGILRGREQERKTGTPDLQGYDLIFDTHFFGTENTCRADYTADLLENRHLIIASGAGFCGKFHSDRRADTGSLFAAFLDGTSPPSRVSNTLRETRTNAAVGVR